MKKIIAFVVLFVVFLVWFIFDRKLLIFVYTNPYTDTSSLSYIAKSIKSLDDAFKYAKFNSQKNGLEYKFLYFNAYGSGFIRGNNIPNDLDYAVGIYLGDYEYNGKNAESIAKSIVDKMNAFETSFCFFMNTSDSANFYTELSPLALMGRLNKQYRKSVYDVETSLDVALSKDNYVKYTQKTLENDNGNLKVDVPYIMKSHEILAENRKPIILYSDLVRYNNVMPRYMREISIIPEFFVGIKKDGVKEIVEIVPESFLGNRLQLSRRFFASSVFVHNSSKNFIKNLSYISDDDEYLYYRLLSFKRHLQEINNIMVMQDRPVKLFKRLMQTADMVSPVLTPNMYKEIYDYAESNLNNRDIQLLNEYINICGNLFNIMEYPKMFFVLRNNGSLGNMYKILEVTVDTLKKRGNVDEKTLIQLKSFQDVEIKRVLSLQNESELKDYRENLLNGKYSEISQILSKAVMTQVNNPEKISKYVGVFNKIYIKSGFHKVSLYWLDNSTLGVVEDDFTRNIKDYKKFAKENELIDINYKLIKPYNVPDMTLRYDVFARYNPTAEQEKNYNDMMKKLLEDRDNFKIKRKIIWCR